MAQQLNLPEGFLQQKSILQETTTKLGAWQNQHLQQAILTQWSELFRTGLVAWGSNISNPDPPLFHITVKGRQALANATRDPSNPAGYLRHLASIAHVDPAAMSYLIEGLDCYVAGLFKASAVMIGAASESLILNLRDVSVGRMKALEIHVPAAMKDWKVKTIFDALNKFFKEEKLPAPLRELFEANWSAFAMQIRSTRNDAGHPTSVDPVPPDKVHASILIFPELAKLTNSLSRWVQDDLKRIGNDHKAP